MGNSIAKEYDVDSRRLVATGGIGLSWRVYNATKKTTGQLVSVFIFEKKSLDSVIKRQQRTAKDIDKTCALLKKEVTTLSRLRHPCLLEMVEPVTESATTLAFATERLVGNLANVLGNYQNFENIIDKSIEKYELDEIEIQKGLLQLAKGLQFCHNDAKIVHCNLLPETIYINAKGDWKLSGCGIFNLAICNHCLSTDPPREIPEFNSQLPSHMEPSLDFASPEFILDQNVNYAMDMFSFGCLIHALYNRGQSPMMNHANILSYRNNIDKLSILPLQNLPPGMDHILRSLLTRTPQGRLSAEEFQNLKYFDNVLITTIRYVETLCEKTNLHKAQFMKGLVRVLPQFPERVLTRKILPALLAELKEHVLTPFTLPNVFWIAEKLTPREFSEKIMPSLKPCFTLKDPIQCTLACLTQVHLIKTKVTSNIFRDDVMPLFYCALESLVPVAQEKCFEVIPAVIDSIDYSAVKASLFPRICNVFATTPSMTAKISALKCCHQILKTLDKHTMSEKLLPILRQNKVRDPGVQVGILNILHEMGKTYLEKETIAAEILPELWRLSIDPLLNVSQFKLFMAAIKELGTKVEEQHARHLTDLKKMEDQSRNLNSGSGATNQNDMSDFEKLLKSGPVDPELPFSMSKPLHTTTEVATAPYTAMATTPMKLTQPTSTSTPSNTSVIPRLQPPSSSVPPSSTNLNFGSTSRQMPNNITNANANINFNHIMQQNVSALTTSTPPTQAASQPAWGNFTSMSSNQQPMNNRFATSSSVNDRSSAGFIHGNGYNTVATSGSSSSLNTMNVMSPTLTPATQKHGAQASTSNQKGLINMFDPYAK